MDSGLTGFSTSPNNAAGSVFVQPGGWVYFGGSNRLYAIWDTPKTVADAPTDVVAVAGLNKVTLTWKAPANDGGYRVTNYLAQADPSGRTCITTSSDANPLSCTIDLPATNTKYTFTAQALNGMGWSSKSAASNAVSPYGFGQIRASRENVLLGLAGTKVQAGGSAPGLAGLAVTPEFKVGAAAQWSREVNAAKVNADGDFAWSRKFPASVNKQNVSVRFTYGGDAVSETLVVARGAKAGSLSAPRNVKVENELNRVTIKWDAPEFDGGAKITGYEVCWTGQGTRCTKASSTEKKVYDMPAGRETTITVKALTGNGKKGPAAKAPKPITPAAMAVAFASRQEKELIATVRYAGFKPGSKIQVEMNSRLPGEQFPAGGFRKVSTLTVDASGAADERLTIPLPEGTEFTMFKVRAVTSLGTVYSGEIPPFRY